MRKLLHPAMEDVTVEGILHALSDPIRARIYLDLAKAECTKNCSSYLNMNKEALPKSTLSQHFSVLREAGLVYSERKGVELHNRTRCLELKERFGDLIPTILEAYMDNAAGKRKRRG